MNTGLLNLFEGSAFPGRIWRREWAYILPISILAYGWPGGNMGMFGTLVIGCASRVRGMRIKLIVVIFWFSLIFYCLRV